MHPDAPYFSILLCLTPDDFTRQVESAATQWLNKLSLAGMQQSEKYGVSSQTFGLRSKHRNSPYIFQVVAFLPTKAC